MSQAFNAVVAETRWPWSEAPAELAACVEELLGSHIVVHQTQCGGFSTGIASRLRCADGRTAFVKAVNAGGDEFAWTLYEREAQVALALPGTLPTPQCLGVIRADGWLALVFEDAGRQLCNFPGTEPGSTRCWTSWLG